VAKPRPSTISWLPWWLRGSIGRWVVRSTVLLLVVGGILAAIIWAGRWGLEQIRGQDQYLASFADIVVEPPAGMDRGHFLDEVRFHGRLDDNRLNVLDEALKARLREAFAAHPWVAEVDEVEVLPPRRIEVTLTYRKAVLAVAWDGEMRAVDGAGVLLPKSAVTTGLPVYEGEPKAPRGPPGTAWGDPEVERAVRRLRLKNGS
jgi:hypothetical protein